MAVDEAAFEVAMRQQREQARAAGRFHSAAQLEYSGVPSVFHGYDTIEHAGRVTALYRDGTSVALLRAGDAGVVVLDHTPFYAESGGQAGDRGVISAADGAPASFRVSDTLKIQADVFGHHGTLESGELRVGQPVRAAVDARLRAQTRRNHSATHLMHKALREVLGPHVQQKGSLVDADKTRFDFSHNAPVSAEQLRRVESMVNAEILANDATRAQVMSFDEAVKGGAMALFGEKYGDEVRVLDIGSSRELCGGTHVARTGDIGLFKIVSEGGVAAGIRRIEAVTGERSLAWLFEVEERLASAAAALKAPAEEVSARIGQLLENSRALERELGRLKSKLASASGDDLAEQAADVKGIKVLAAQIPGADVAALRETVDRLKERLKTAAIVLASVDGGKVSLIAGVTADATARVKAGDLVNFVARQVGGKGGGRPEMAQAGGTDPSALGAALAGVAEWVAARA